jgi:hypothetical protein
MFPDVYTAPFASPLTEVVTPNFSPSDDSALPHSYQQAQIIVRIVSSVAEFAAKRQRAV